MKVFNNQKNKSLTTQLKKELIKYRKEKSFDPKEYLFYKVTALNHYLIKHNIDSVVIGISGGIDSAVSLGILKKAKKFKQLKHICAICEPALNNSGAVSNQNSATKKGILVIKHFKENPKVIDLSQILKAGINSTKSLNLEQSNWANGQLVPNLRTSLNYYITSLFSENKNRAIVIGTINRDEGSYLGFMGKAGDSLVDIQLISDLHKSEVYKLAKYLKIPKEIIKAIPSGDMFDNRSDEEVFGATYDFVELYMKYLKNNPFEKELFKNKLNLSSLTQFNELSKKLEKLHNHNKHKYISSSSAIHFDLFDTWIEGGWKNNSTYNKDLELNPNNIVNFQKIDESILNNFKESSKLVLTKKEIKLLLSQIKYWQPAGVDGYSNKTLNNEIGSYRATIFSKKFANALNKRIKAKKLLIHDNKVYRYQGLSSSFRLVKYEKNGKLVPHYDFPYIFSENKKTLFSVVIYLQKPKKGGETRFIKETRKNHDFKDWIDAKEQDLIIESIPKVSEGEALIFPHQKLHDSSIILDGQKIIIRTDLIYEQV